MRDNALVPSAHGREKVVTNHHGFSMMVGESLVPDIFDWNWEEAHVRFWLVDRGKTSGTFVIVSMLLLLVSSPLWALRGSPRVIEEVTTKEPGIWQLQGGLRFESARTLTEDNQEFDNVRLRNLGVRWGATDFLEIGADFSYSSNSADQSVPDESEIERTNLRLKIPWHEFLSSSIRVGFGGGESVQPYGMEDVSAGINFPFRLPFARGALHGEVGMDFQSGDVKDLGGINAEWDDSVHYGLGYVYDIHPLASMSVELKGRTATAESDSVDFEDLLELNIGSQLHLSNRSRISPELAFGLLEGSPDFAIGVGYEVEFGRRYEPKDTMDHPLREPRYAPTEREKERERKISSTRPPSQTSNQQIDVESGEVERLVEEGRKAFRRGDLSMAIEKFRQAEKQLPSSLIIQSNLASLYFRNEQYIRAREHYRKAIDIDRQDTFSHYYLGLTFYRLGQPTMAKRHLQRVLQLDPNHKGAREWLNRIR